MHTSSSLLLLVLALLASCDVSVSVTRVHLGHLKELCPQVAWLIDPACFPFSVRDLLQPSFVSHAGLCSIDFLEPDVFAQLLQVARLGQIVALNIIVDHADATVFVGEFEDITSYELA